MKISAEPHCLKTQWEAVGEAGAGWVGLTSWLPPSPEWLRCGDMRLARERTEGQGGEAGSGSLSWAGGVGGAVEGGVPAHTGAESPWPPLSILDNGDSSLRCKMEA